MDVPARRTAAGIGLPCTDRVSPVASLAVECRTVQDRRGQIEKHHVRENMINAKACPLAFLGSPRRTVKLHRSFCVCPCPIPLPFAGTGHVRCVFRFFLVLSFPLSDLHSSSVCDFGARLASFPTWGKHAMQRVGFFATRLGYDNPTRRCGADRRNGSQETVVDALTVQVREVITSMVLGNSSAPEMDVSTTEIETEMEIEIDILLL